MNSFVDNDLIDEIIIFTSNKSLDKAQLKNPLKIDERWQIKSNKQIGVDNVINAVRKVECLQES